MPSEPTQASPNRTPRPFTSALLRAVLITVLCASIIMMTHGMLSWVLDRDIIPERDANVLVVVSMASVTVVVIFLATLSGITPERRDRQQNGLAILAALGVYALTPAAGGLAYALVTGRLLAFAPFATAHLLSPFVLASAIITALTILALPLLGRIRSRPR